jgi:hypothetical protein
VATRRPYAAAIGVESTAGILGAGAKNAEAVDNRGAGCRVGPYSDDVPLGPDPERARAVLARLDDLRATVAAAEDEILACLVVTGEPRPQRVLDDWLDQVADTLRAVGDVADGLGPPLARYAGQPASRASTHPTAEDELGSPPTGPVRGDGVRPSAPGGGLR